MIQVRSQVQELEKCFSHRFVIIKKLYIDIKQDLKKKQMLEKVYLFNFINYNSIWQKSSYFIISSTGSLSHPRAGIPAIPACTSIIPATWLAQLLPSLHIYYLACTPATRLTYLLFSLHICYPACRSTIRLAHKKLSIKWPT